MLYRPNLVVIGASTGGPPTLQNIVGSLKHRLTFPVVVVNHIPKGSFVHHLADSLSKTDKAKGVVIEDGMKIEGGNVFICPGGFHLELFQKGGALTARLLDTPPHHGCKPSVDIFFKSVSVLKQYRIWSVILTGMGDDGLEGCRQMKRSGHAIITQEKSSCVVYGMPKAVDDAEVSDANMTPQELAVSLSIPDFGAGASALAQVRNEQNSHIYSQLREDMKKSAVQVETTSASDQSFAENLLNYISNLTGNTQIKGNREVLLSKVNQFIKKHHELNQVNYKQVLQSSSDLQNEIVDKLTVHESYFFRDQVPFHFLRDEIFPQFKDNKNLQIWSCGSAGGQEVYSVVISWLKYCKEKNVSEFRLKCTASDISHPVMQKSKEGVYNRTEVTRGLLNSDLEEYFSKIGNQYKISDRIKSFVEFKPVNLIQSLSSFSQFDVIFCRYTMIYFDEIQQKKCVDFLQKHLKPNGVLLTDPAMSLRVAHPKLDKNMYKSLTYFKLAS